MATSGPGKREHEIDPAHDRRIDEAAEIAGEQAEKGGDGEGAGGDHDRSDQRGPRAIDHARQHVAAEQVGAGDELRRRRRVADEEPLGEGRVGRDRRSEDRADDDDGDDQPGEPDDHRDASAGAGSSGDRQFDGQRHDCTLPKRMRGSIRV